MFISFYSLTNQSWLFNQACWKLLFFWFQIYNYKSSMAKGTVNKHYTKGVNLVLKTNLPQGFFFLVLCSGRCKFKNSKKIPMEALLKPVKCRQDKQVYGGSWKIYTRSLPWLQFCKVALLSWSSNINQAVISQVSKGSIRHSSNRASWTTFCLGF